MSPLEFFSDYSYRMVFWGTGAIGITAGALGAFTFLRKQSLITDVVSHSSLLGIVAGFSVAVGLLGIDGRSAAVLVISATVIGVLASLFANVISRRSPIGIDAAMAVILALCFGAGIVGLRLVINSSLSGKGGLGDYLFGKAASMTQEDLWSITAFGGGAIIIMALAWKPFVAVAFDPDFARQLGYRIGLVDAVMFSTMVIAVVVGIKAVGIVLMVAFAIAPPAAARQWTRHVGTMVVFSSVIGGIGAVTGSYLAVSIGSVPTGPIIVLVLTAIVILSLLFAPQRSLVARWVQERRARTRVGVA